MPKTKSKYRILRGTHVDAQGTHEPGVNEVVESERDLAKQYPERFQRLTGTVDDEDKPHEIPPPVVDLEQMTVQELRAYADAEEIDLGTATKKDDIVSAIRKALDAR